MSEVVLEWKEEQDSKLNELAKTYLNLDEQIKSLTKCRDATKNSIIEYMNQYGKKKVLTESYSAACIHVEGNRTFDSKKAKEKLMELNVEIDDTYYKLGKAYDKVEIKQVDKKELLTETNDPHQIKITLEDLNI